MTTTDLGACEWFVWDLRRSNLIDRGQLDQVIGAIVAADKRVYQVTLEKEATEGPVPTLPFERRGNQPCLISLVKAIRACVPNLPVRRPGSFFS